MKSGFRRWLKQLPTTLTAASAEPAERAQRIVALQRNIILPARLVVIGVVFYQLYFQSRLLVTAATSYGVLLETIQNTFNAYTFLIIGATVLLTVVRRPPPGSVQWVVFVIGLGDGVFLAALTVLTGGFESILYWVYPAVIVLNAISIPLATPQIVLNLVLAILYLVAGLIESNTNTHFERYLSPSSVHRTGTKKAGNISAKDIGDLQTVVAWLKQSPAPLLKQMWETIPQATRDKLSGPIAPEDELALKQEIADTWNATLLRGSQMFIVPTPTSETTETGADPYVLRVAVLLLLTFCCYGVQVLVAAQERAQEEQKEFYVRTGQLQMAGRLAAEFAHQIKNPMTIVNNVTFSLQRMLQGGKPEVSQQVAIIQEEVAKADQIITQIMGYAQLSEGRIEKLTVVEELERAIQQVFPPGIPTDIKVHRDYAGNFPPLLMQRRHFSEAVSNLLQNARDVLVKGGNIFIQARCVAEYSVEVIVRDDGRGIPPDKLERIFEAYYTTKERGTGLGLAIVKHNVDLYGGSVRVESELGKGAKFTLVFPAKSLIQLGK